MYLYEKTDGFPTVHYPSLIEFPERRKFMLMQFDKYGINKTKLLLTDRYDKIKDRYTLLGEPDYIIHGHPGNIISYITLIKDWYDTSSEEYAIFCDDDIDFSTVEYWNFTWNNFVDSLPENWECVQLIRIEEWAQGLGEYVDLYNEVLTPSLSIRQRKWCQYGTAFLIKKSYAKKILDRHYINETTINTVVPNEDMTFLYWPIVENVLFKNLGIVYNFPLFIENCNFESFLKKQVKEYTEENWNLNRYPHKRSREIYENLWKVYGPTSNLKEMLSVV